jgi:hypothetical protein
MFYEEHVLVWCLNTLPYALCCPSIGVISGESGPGDGDEPRRGQHFGAFAATWQARHGDRARTGIGNVSNVRYRDWLLAPALGRKRWSIASGRTSRFSLAN